MRKNDTGPVRDIAVAFVLLTRLPLPALPARAFAHQARAGWAFGLVGLAVGALAGSAGLLAMAAGLPAAVAAGLALAVQVVVTGALHEDGLADCADGFWGGMDRERRLAIMRDSRIGSYGVLALILGMGLRWAALAALLPSGIGGLVAAAILSRGVLPGLMALIPPARDDGLSVSVGRPTRAQAAAGLVLAAGLAALVAGSAAVAMLAAALAAAALAGGLARSRIGGQTGDVLGAAQVLAELACLLAVLALA